MLSETRIALDRVIGAIKSPYIIVVKDLGDGNGAIYANGNTIDIMTDVLIVINSVKERLPTEAWVALRDYLIENLNSM